MPVLLVITHWIDNQETQEGLKTQRACGWEGRPLRRWRHKVPQDCQIWVQMSIIPPGSRSRRVSLKKKHVEPGSKFYLWEKSSWTESIQRALIDMCCLVLQAVVSCTMASNKGPNPNPQNMWIHYLTFIDVIKLRIKIKLRWRDYPGPSKDTQRKVRVNNRKHDCKSKTRHREEFSRSWTWQGHKILPWSPQKTCWHLDFRFLISRTVRKVDCDLWATKFVVICYSRSRKLIHYVNVLMF